MIDLAATDSGHVSAVLHADTALTDTQTRYGVVVIVVELYQTPNKNLPFHKSQLP